MDMMEMRFRMMTMIGGTEMVGELSKYYKTTVREQEDFLTITVELPWNITPKFVQITCADDSVPYITNGYVRYFVCGESAGVVEYVNKSNGIDTLGVLWPAASVTTVGRYALNNNGYFEVTRVNANGLFAGSTDYIVEIYA